MNSGLPCLEAISLMAWAMAGDFGCIGVVVVPERRLALGREVDEAALWVFAEHGSENLA